ncbi:ABC transporter permease [Novosphingobium sp. SL115]|uniref:ABC transporter permease n=1 Tax=Novosphingobium sp. SL115 TaxID=2995150 RepID=UPI0022770546|nr:ABC transporter permease [Novosphingobium sp. SL115]MCY1670850.1 ABC transporter permease [Novosphingobium sp. SL115]
MNAVPLRKDEFLAVKPKDKEESAPLLPIAKETSSVPTAPKLPFGLKLPDMRSAAEAAWPPLVGIGAFLGLWALLAPLVQTSLGALPGPGDVWAAFTGLMEENAAARVSAAEAVAAGYSYSGPPTFIDQIGTSLFTVAAGFLLATLFAVPLGLVAGMSKRVNAAINPLVQVMRPISPLAWLPIVTMVVSASMTSDDPTLAKSFVVSAVVVMLCSLWPTLINTAIGTASIDKDLIAVGRVLRLGWFAKLTRLVLPSSLPYIFTGMRLSLGTGWMVLIAAEMLAQNPGLGKFVWDEFQNGSEKSLARIMVAVVVIGLIGFGLDRVMMAMQAFVSRNRTV